MENFLEKDRAKVTVSHAKVLKAAQVKWGKKIKKLMVGQKTWTLDTVINGRVRSAVMDYVDRFLSFSN